jgi:5-methylcytosine-specific restriction enzyme A
MRKDWTEAENRALCFAWCVMHDAWQAGTKFNKSAIRRELIGTDEAPGPLHARSNGSVEAKLMNVSAAAVQLGIEPLKGYKPAPNFQKSLVATLREVRDMLDRENTAIAAKE